MAEKKQCVHCRRSIDTAARICPYCNRDQDLKQQAPAVTVPLPPIDAAPPAKPARRFSRDRWSTRALLIAAVLALLMATFAVGGLVYGLGKRGDTSIGSRRTAEAAEALDRGGRDLPGMELVADSSSTIGRPLTSAPMPDSDQQVPAEFQRSDATALPSAEYARLLEESRRQQQEQQQPPEQPASVDPRTVKTELPGAGVRPPAPPSGESREDFPAETREESEPAPRNIEPEPAPRRERERAHRTEPVPIYQPLPRIKDREEEIEESGTMRFRLTVDRDGEVKEIRVIETMPGMTGKMIAAMQRWKFKPATENGVPVEGTFMVDISFNAPQ